MLFLCPGVHGVLAVVFRRGVEMRGSLSRSPAFSLGQASQLVVAVAVLLERAAASAAPGRSDREEREDQREGQAPRAPGDPV